MSNNEHEQVDKEKLTEVCCRSAVCGGDVFIPNSEYQGGSCDLTCDINNSKPD